ncbi:response regulator, partial [Myxococcota bacterium]|nr:response regulator [Myxococcota bacterium]
RSTLFEKNERKECELRLLPVGRDPIWTRVDLTATKGKDGSPLIKVLLSDINDRKQAEDELRLYEWLTEKESSDPHQDDQYDPVYDDPTELNTSRLILEGMGSGALGLMAEDILTLMDTCVAVYEANGDYAYGKFESAWCQAMDNASFQLCDCQDTKAALASGKWLCHENCWNDSAKAAIESGHPTDITCVGGIKLYAVPIRSGDTIVGVLNFGYGTPPRDEKTLLELAQKFKIDVAHLRRRSHEYKPRPQFIINVAKNRCVSMARMIGQNLERVRFSKEKGLLEEQLQQSQKMESIGRLAGGIAHDFNNLLTAILGFAEFVRGSMAEQDPLRDDVDEIMKAANSAATLTAQLLTFSRKQLISPMALNLNEAILRTEKLLHRLLGDDINLNIITDKALHLVKIDPVQVDQILVNLAVNAGDAILNGGTITIETQNVSLEKDHYFFSNEELEGDFVLLTVGDTGAGISPEIIKNIFEPFFSTKARGKGTGLGLSTVYGIVKQNNGYINAASKGGKGTVISILLPSFQGETESPEEEKKVTSVSGTETILLVEDQELVRKLAQKILRSRGYKIVEAENGEDALLKFQQFTGKIDLLVTDVVMPLQNGRDLYEKLLLIEPNLKALFMSGYTEEVIAHHGVLDSGTNFIQKPFRPQEMAKKVRQILDT